MATEHHLKIPRSARYFTLGESVGSPTEIWVVCHGYGQLAEQFLDAFAPLAEGPRLIVAPEGLSRFYLEPGGHGPQSRVGASWMTKEDRLSEIDDYMGYLDALRGAVFAPAHRHGARLTVLGFSQGTATATRWVLRRNVRAERLILWGGLLPPDTDLHTGAATLNALDLALVAGERDEYATPELLARQRVALEAAGVRHRVVTFEGGHRIDVDALRRLVTP